MTVWANHGDDISIQYSGTLSLKGELVIRGIIDIFVPKASCMTPEGIFKDGWNALMRYYLNNFVDGTKQDRACNEVPPTVGMNHDHAPEVLLQFPKYGPAVDWDKVVSGHILDQVPTIPLNVACALLIITAWLDITSGLYEQAEPEKDKCHEDTGKKWPLSLLRRLSKVDYEEAMFICIVAVLARLPGTTVYQNYTKCFIVTMLHESVVLHEIVSESNSSVD
ncbi:phosphoinositide phosphatase SAC6, partial [Tanacetum coccineum]